MGRLPLAYSRDEDGESEIRSGARGVAEERGEREKERERGSVLRSVARGEDEGDSPFGKQFSYDEWTE